MPLAPHSLTISQRHAIVRRFVAGESGAKIAADFGCDRAHPNHLARYWGVAARRRPFPRVKKMKLEPRQC